MPTVASLGVAAQPVEHSIDWPDHLVERVARERWVLFIGSGVSHSSSNRNGESPPDWVGLLRTLCSQIRDPSARAVGASLIDGSQLLAAADHIRHVMDAERNLAGYFQTIRTSAEGPPADKFSPSALFNSLLSLEPRVVFTTNYDKLFEMASRSGFQVHQYGSNNLSHDLRQGEAVLVKLHGSTDDINEIVLTRTDYSRVADRGRRVFEALEALSLTSTIIFVGYSLDDPDIQLVLQTVGRTGLSPEAHFMISPEPASSARVPVFRESFGVSVLTYPAGKHTLVKDAIDDLGTRVLAARSNLGAAAP
jgi:hypothetical protein